MKYQAIERVIAFPTSSFANIEAHQRRFDLRLSREYQQTRRIKRKHWLSRILHLGLNDASLLAKHRYNDYGIRLRTYSALRDKIRDRITDKN